MYPSHLSAHAPVYMIKGRSKSSKERSSRDTSTGVHLDVAWENPSFELFDREVSASLVLFI